VGALSLSQNLAGKPNVEDSEVKRYVAPADIEDDAQLMSRLKALLEERELYLDPDLTLARLSKRLGVPAKQLSTTINRATGENVSRYINSYRIGRARERLAAGETVTVAMLESGFNTKSNFNREFLRVVGSTPSQWRAGQQA
jgi:AraC-like DNA-binding protein